LVFHSSTSDCSVVNVKTKRCYRAELTVRAEDQERIMSRGSWCI